MSFLYIFSFLFVCSGGKQKLFFAKFFVESVGNVKQVSNKNNQKFRSFLFFGLNFFNEMIFGFLTLWESTRFYQLYFTDKEFKLKLDQIRFSVTNFPFLIIELNLFPFSTLSERKVFKIFHPLASNSETFSNLTRLWAENCAILLSNFFIFHELIERFCVAS